MTHIKMVIIATIWWWCRLVLSEAEVAAAAATTATIASSSNAADQEHRLKINKLNIALGLHREHLTLQAGDVTTKYALTFSSPNCSAMYKPSDP